MGWSSLFPSVLSWISTYTNYAVLVRNQCEPHILCAAQFQVMFMPVRFQVSKIHGYIQVADCAGFIAANTLKYLQERSPYYHTF